MISQLPNAYKDLNKSNKLNKYCDILENILVDMSHKRNNEQVIDGLNIVLRPLCKNPFLGVHKELTENQMFKIDLLQDLKFEVGISHCTDLKTNENLADPLSGYVGAGFVNENSVNQQLHLLPNVKSSNTSVQLSLHKPVVAKLSDFSIPMLGGIYGTSRDIFTALHDVIGPGWYWQIFNVISAFMIKHRYHTLLECFICANQVYKKEIMEPRCNSAFAIYKTVKEYSKIDF